MFGNLLSVFLEKKRTSTAAEDTDHQDFSTMKQFTQKSKYKHGNNCVAGNFSGIGIFKFSYLTSAKYSGSSKSTDT